MISVGDLSFRSEELPPQPREKSGDNVLGRSGPRKAIPGVFRSSAISRQPRPVGLRSGCLKTSGRSFLAPQSAPVVSAGGHLPPSPTGKNKPQLKMGVLLHVFPLFSLLKQWKFPYFWITRFDFGSVRKAVPNQAPQGSRILCSRELTSPRFPGSRIITTDHPTTTMKCEYSYGFRHREHHPQTFCANRLRGPPSERQKMKFH